MTAVLSDPDPRVCPDCGHPTVWLRRCQDCGWSDKLVWVRPGRHIYHATPVCNQDSSWREPVRKRESVIPNHRKCRICFRGNA